MSEELNTGTFGTFDYIHPCDEAVLSDSQEEKDALKKYIVDRDVSLLKLNDKVKPNVFTFRRLSVQEITKLRSSTIEIEEKYQLVFSLCFEQVKTTDEKGKAVTIKKDAVKSENDLLSYIVENFGFDTIVDAGMTIIAKSVLGKKNRKPLNLLAG